MDEKDNNQGRFNFKGKIEVDIDPSSLKLEDDGSMSEPSFNSDDNDTKDDSFEKSNDNEPVFTPASDDEDEEEIIEDDDFDDGEDEEELLEDDDLDDEIKDDDRNESIDNSKPVDSSNESEEVSEPKENGSTEEKGSGETTQEEPSKEQKSDEKSGEESSEDKKSEESSKDKNEEDNKEENTSEESKDKDEESSSEQKDNEDKKDEEEGIPSEDNKEDSSTSDNEKNDNNEKDSDNTTKDNKNEPEGKDDKPVDNKKDNVGDKEEPKSKDNKPEVPEGKDAAKEAVDKGKDGAKEAVDKGKDAAKEAADKTKEAAKETADKAKDVAKETADKAKDAAKEVAKDKAGDAAKKNPVGSKADIAKNTADAFKKGPKGLVGAPGVRAALAASENTNVYSKAGKKIIDVLDLVIGKDRVDWILNKLGESALKHMLMGVILSILSILIPIILLIIGIYLIFAPLIDTLASLDQYAHNIANTAEKIINLYKNGRFADSKTAFYEEMETLGNLYGDDLDETLLLSTLFYSDMKFGYDTRYDSLNDIIISESSKLSSDTIAAYEESGGSVDYKTVYVETFLSIIGKEIESLEADANGEYDSKTGLYYTTGKVYRLRHLAGQMFSSQFLGSASDYNEEEMTLRKWLSKDKYGGQLLNTIKETIEDLAVNIATDGLIIGVGAALTAFGVGTLAVCPPIGILSLISGLFLTSIGIGEAGRDLEDALLDFKLLLNCGYLGYMSLKSIEFDDDLTISNWSWDNLLDYTTITFYSYKYSEENYKKYLKEVYIPESGDFDKYLSYDSNGDPTEASIDRIINEIFDYKKYFEELFYEKELDFSENYSELCIGAIDRKLASAMDLPVDINTTNCIDFSGDNGFGYNTSGLLHNGIELNERTTGNHAGDKVYSVMNNGIVRSSSADNSMECVGGCLEIEYSSTSNIIAQSEFHFAVIYKGLSKSSVTLKTGDVVTGDDRSSRVIGTIGTAEESENMGIPSLYFEFRNADGTAIDPTNAIVKCSSPGAGDYDGATTMTVPQSFKQGKGYTVTCLLPQGFDWGCDYAGDIKVGKATDVYPIYQLWVDQGANYKDGLAIMYVDGVERYLVATTRTFGKVGDVVNFKLENGDVIPAVLFDEKSLSDSTIVYVDGTPWGHQQGGGAVSVVEFEAHNDAYKNSSQGPSVNSSNGYNIGWDSNSPVVSFSNNGNVKSGNFDITSKATSGNIGGTTSNGLTLCASMFANTNADIYVNKAIEMANDNTIGYDMGSTRDLNPNVDCSSLVYYALATTGFIPNNHSAFNTGSMGGVLVANGFDELDYNEADLRKGDIIVDPRTGENGHTVIYIGDGKQVAAHSNYDGVNGDSGGNEVNVSEYSKGSHQYTKMYRLKEVANTVQGTSNDNSGSTQTYGTASGSTIMKHNGTDYVVVNTKYPGGVSGYQQMLEKNGICQAAVGENGKCKIPSNNAKSGWGGCCGGFSQAQACGLYKGTDVTQSSGQLSKCNSAGNSLKCSTGWGSGKCFDTVSSFMTYVIENVQSGHPVIINVTGCDGNKSSCPHPKGTYSRHYVTVVGFKNGSNGSSYKDLLIIDSWDSSLKTLGKRKIQTDGIIIDGHPCGSSTKNFAIAIQ